MSNRGKFWWNELDTWDVEAAKEFYSKTMGWEFEEIPSEQEGLASYWIANKDGQRICGMFSLRSPDFDGVPSHWFTYIAVDDIDREIETALAAGGELRRDKITIPNWGTFAVIIDPTGAGFGMIQPATDVSENKR